MRRPLLNFCLILLTFLLIGVGCRDVNPVASTDSVPSITSVVPAEAPYGATVQIGGEGFGGNLSEQEVYFNNTLAQIEALSDTSIQTKVPLEATTGPVMVITNNGDTLSGPSFTVDSTKNLFLNIDSINPTKGRAGDEVQIVGNGFGPSPEMNTVLFNDVKAPVTSASDTMLTTTISADVETGPVSVVVGQDTAVGPVFTVERLSISGISPESGPIGTAVTISGSGFSSTISENTVTFAGVEAPIETASETELVGIVPDGAETGPVAVTVGDENVQGPTFTIEATQSPKTLQVITETTNPPSGFDGYRLSVTGRDVVFINPNGERTYSDILADQVDVELTSIPETCTVSGQNPRTITLENQSTTTTFNIECALPAPLINSVTPQSGSVGTQVTINGENFSATPSENIITFNGTEAPVNSASTTELITEVPEGATNGPIEVTVNGQTAEGPTFTVEADAPVISSIDPQSGVVGTEVTITGENFSATPSENVITFNGTQAPVNSASANELVTEVPEGATDGPVEVSVDGKTGAGPDFDVVTTGSLDVVISTQGEDQDSNGYLVSIDGAEGVRTSINETYNQSGLQEGTHQVGISDIAENCFITQDRPNPYDVTITAGQTTNTNVDVQCEAKNEPPQAAFEQTCLNLNCGFDGTSSADPDGSITSYEWNLGDGTTASGDSTIHAYSSSGVYNVSLTVTDNEGATNTVTKSITVTELTITGISPASGPIGTEVTISGTGFGSVDSLVQAGFTSGETIVTAPIKSLTSTELIVDVPGDATTGPVYVARGENVEQGPEFTVEQSRMLEVAISTTGSNIDPDGYTLSVEGQDDRIVKVNDNVTYSNLILDEIQVALNGIADNCSVEGNNPRTVTLNNADNAGFTQFDVSCAGAAPSIDSISPTSGTTSTQVTISGNNFSSTASDNVVTFNGVRAELNSATTTELVAFVPFDATTGPVEVTVNGQTATGPTFTVITTGRLEVNISTTGTSIDPDGYGLILDGGPATAVNVNDSAGYNDLSEGSHSVELTDIASNCFITQDRPNPYDVNITAGDTTITNIDVHCEEPNQAPSASFNNTCSGGTCDFDGSGSTDTDGFISSYDWNFGDGFSGGGQTVTHTYENSGTYTVSLTVTDNEGASDTISEQISISLGDDDLDAVVGSNPRLVFTNDGNGNFTQSVELGNFQPDDIEMSDVDRDNDLDILIGSGPGLALWINDGTGQFTLKTEFSADLDQSYDFEVGDLNGDGFPDIFQIGSGSTLTDHPHWVWINNGSGGFIDSGQRLGGENSTEADLGDVDGDGDLDAIVTNDDKQYGNGSNSNTIWLNDGDGNFTDSDLRLGSSLSQDVKLGDLDGDGDLDAFVFNDDVFETQQNRVYLNNGDGFLEDSGQLLGSYRSMNGALGDLDGDGDLDAFFVTFESGSRVWLNDGNGKFTNSEQVIGNQGGKEIKLGDVDGDKDLDALVINSFTTLIWFNDGSGVFSNSTQIHDEGGYSGDLGDVD